MPSITFVKMAQIVLDPHCVCGTALAIAVDVHASPTLLLTILLQ
jgi:hypothetical protein